MNRRDFLTKTAAVATMAALAPHLAQADDSDGSKRRPIKRGIMWGTIGVNGSVLDKMKAVKDAGFDGVEMNSHMDQDDVMKAKEATGLQIASVCGVHHWGKPLTSPDPKIRAEGLDALKQTLRDAHRYGATSILLVPGIVSKEISYPEAWERSQTEIRKAIPLATELGVKIAIENVWNQFLLSPMEAARFVDEFNSPAVGWHFDVGNVINYGWPEQWVRVLGKRIQKLHIKEFSRTRRDKEGLWKGFDVKLLEGDDNWPAVVKALDDIHYDNWAITEQGGGDTPEGLRDLRERLDKILSL